MAYLPRAPEGHIRSLTEPRLSRLTAAEPERVGTAGVGGAGGREPPIYPVSQAERPFGKTGVTKLPLKCPESPGSDDHWVSGTRLSLGCLLTDRDASSWEGKEETQNGDHLLPQHQRDEDIIGGLQCWLDGLTVLSPPQCPPFQSGNPRYSFIPTCSHCVCFCHIRVVNGMDCFSIVLRK